MKVRAVVFIADELQGGDSEILTKESLKISQYMLNPVVFKNYYNVNPIGRVSNLIWEGDKLIADIELIPGSEELFLKSYPAIGYMQDKGINVYCSMQRKKRRQQN